MKFLWVCALLVIAAKGHTFLSAEKEAFRVFKIQYGKTYTSVEEATRFDTFMANLKAIEEHNALYEKGLVSWRKGVTKFADMTDDEYLAWLGVQKRQEPTIMKQKASLKMASSFGEENVPDSLDWRDKGAVTPVKNQGACFASWAFALAGSVESAFFVKTGKLVPLSVQQLVDCTAAYGGSCSLGYLRETMPYIQHKGLESERDYPYAAKEGQCQYNASKVVTKIDTFVHFYDNQYQLLQSVANYGPVAAGMDISELKDYTGGIYVGSTCSSFNFNHAVLIVGYGSENGTNFWTLKTSLGSTWGEEGYLRIERKARDLACGLYKLPVYPRI